MGLNTERLQKEFSSLLIKPVKNVKVQIIFIEFKSPHFNKLMEGVRQTFIKLGISPDNISEFDLYSENPPSLSNIDVVLMFGGNEYHYMSQIRKHGLYSEIRKFVERDGVYIGISAGAIIMGPDVDIEYWSTASNDVGLEDTSGFGFVDFITVPHVDTRKEAEKVLEFHKKTGHKMIYLTDEQGILVLDDLYKIV